MMASLLFDVSAEGRMKALFVFDPSQTCPPLLIENFLVAMNLLHHGLGIALGFQARLSRTFAFTHLIEGKKSLTVSTMLCA